MLYDSSRDIVSFYETLLRQTSSGNPYPNALARETINDRTSGTPNLGCPVGRLVAS